MLQQASNSSQHPLLDLINDSYIKRNISEIWKNILDSFLTIHNETNQTAKYIIGTFTCVVILISLFGNTLVLVAVGKTRSLQRINNVWYVSLACADLIRACFCMPIFAILMFAPDLSFQLEICSIYHSLQMSIEVVTIFHLTAISIDRAFVISRPLMYQRIITPIRMGSCIVLLWILSFLYGFLQLFWWEEPDTRVKGLFDVWLFQFSRAGLECKYEPSLAFAITDFVVAFVIPLIIMSIAYTKIFIIVHMQMRKMKRRASQMWDEEGSDGSYSRIPAITKSINTSTGKSKSDYTNQPTLEKGLTQICEVQHEHSSSPNVDKSTDNESDDMINKHNRRTSDLSVIDIDDDLNKNNNAKSSVDTKGNSINDDSLIITDLEEESNKEFHKSRFNSLPIFKPIEQQNNTINNSHETNAAPQHKRLSVQFNLCEEESTEGTTNSTAAKRKPMSNRTRMKIMLDSETTTSQSEAVTMETWLSGTSSNITDQKLTARKPKDSQIQTQIWASRHFNVDQNFSYTSGTPRPSMAESTNSGQTWNSILQRRRKSLQNIKENKAVKMTAIVVGAFVVCWLPYELTYFLRNIRTVSVPDTVWYSVNFVAYCSSAVNPLVYNFYSSEFRRAARRVLCCKDNQVGPWM